MNTLLAALLPQLASAAIAVVVPVIVATAVKYFQKLGIDIEAKNREALQSALENAAAIALAHSKGKTVAAASTPSITDTAVDYVKSSVPDAVKKFGLDRNKIEKLLEPHIAKGVNKVEK